MMNPEEQGVGKTPVAEGETSGTEHGSACENIGDPIRKGLCKVCGLPVIGQAPFCKDHEPPVP